MPGYKGRREMFGGKNAGYRKSKLTPQQWKEFVDEVCTNPDPKGKALEIIIARHAMGENASLEEVGTLMGMSKGGVMKLEMRALAKIKAGLAKLGIHSMDDAFDVSKRDAATAYKNDQGEGDFGGEGGKGGADGE